jgi:cytochrome c oxidase subunit 2
MNDFLRRYLFLPQQASTYARPLDELHYSIILSAMAGAILVTMVGGIFLIRYRRSRYPETEPPNPEANARPHPLFKVAALVGLMFLFVLWWIVGLGQFMRMRIAPEGSMIVYVSAKQWMWEFAYPEGARSIAKLYVPVGRPVKLVLTSRDVIHSFFVPSFRMKEDAIPGRYTTAWFQAIAPGTYPVLCTQYCGTGHSTMRADVIVMAPRDYEEWLAGQTDGKLRIAGPRYEEPGIGLTDVAPPQQTSFVRQGEMVAAQKGCFRCHTVDGSPHIGPTWAGLYLATVPLEGGGEVVADEAYLTESMMDPEVKIHLGYQHVMPSYLGRLDAGETAAIVELIKSLRDVRPEPGARTPLTVQRDAGMPEEEDDSQGHGARELPPKPEPPGGEIPR